MYSVYLLYFNNRELLARCMCTTLIPPVSDNLSAFGGPSISEIKHRPCLTTGIASLKNHLKCGIVGL